MATALKLKSDIKKLKAAIGSKATPASFKSKLKTQLDKAENELASLQKGGRPRKSSTTKSTKTTLTALQKLIQKKKYGVYKGAGVDLEKDASQPAMARGKRVSKGLKSNQFGDKKDNKGNVYYEYRPNRLDVKQPSKKARYPKLEKGGEISVDDKVEEYIDKLKNGESIRRYYHVRGTSNPKYFETIMPNKSEKGLYKRYESASKSSLGTLQNEYLTEKEVKNYLKKTIVEIRKEFYKDKMASGGMMSRGGYVAVSEKDGYWYIMSRPTTKEMAQELIDMGVPRGEVGKVVSVEEAKSHKKVIGAEYLENGSIMAKGGEVVPYIIWVSKDGDKRELYGEYISMRAANMKMDKLWESGEYERIGNMPKSKYEKEGFYKDGGMMAKGGGIYSSDSLYILTISKDGDKVGEERFRAKNITEAKEMGEDFEEKYKGKFGGDLSFNVTEAMASGGMMARGGYVSKGELVWRKLSASKRMEFLYENFTPEITPRGQELLVGKDFNFLPKNVKIKLEAKYADVEEYASGGMMDMGGEVGQGFLIRDMREKLNRMFPDSFGFTVANFSKEGDKFKNYAALIVEPNDPYRGLEDKDIQSKLFFPQYKRDHNIRFRIYQGGENTYFYFNLESEKGDEYIGQFGFKDSGDVSPDYITRFIAFLMEQYGLPFEVNHTVMADGGQIPDNYEGKNAGEIWNSMSKGQRQHFLYDHATEIEDYRGEEFGEFGSKEIIQAYNSNFDELDKNIRNRFENHVRMGQYAKGGKTKQDRYNYGRSWAADRARHNKSENYETPMNKRKLEHGGELHKTQMQ
jgi:hypothetical protein